MGIVALDHLRQNHADRETHAALGPGETDAFLRSKLHDVLETYGIHCNENDLNELTTHGNREDAQRLISALKCDASFAGRTTKERDDMLVHCIQSLVLLALRWPPRQALKVNCDRQLSPSSWIGSILEQAKERSGGKVEQHLVGAKLATRHPEIDVPNHPGHAGDAQTGRTGDFNIGTTSYHVTASPGSNVIAKCAENLREGMHPLLLVPREQVERARILADDQGIRDRLTVIAIEDFIAINIIEMSVGDQQQFIDKLRTIVSSYNSRLEAVETDLSLKIELS